MDRISGSSSLAVFLAVFLVGQVSAFAPSSGRRLLQRHAQSTLLHSLVLPGMEEFDLDGGGSNEAPEAPTDANGWQDLSFPEEVGFVCLGLQHELVSLPSTPFVDCS